MISPFTCLCTRLSAISSICSSIKSGISIFEIREEHVFSRTGIARGHHVFAQANSLAVAVINDEIALTSSADIRFVRSVKLG